MAVRIEGAVEHACELAFADFVALDGQIDDVAALVPGRSGGAVLLRSVLALARPTDDATHLTVEAVDDSFSACVPLEAVLDKALLAYRDGDAPLDKRKGGPVRMLIPDAAACNVAGVDACANVKFVGRLLVTAGPVSDSRPTSEESHEALHKQPGHEHLDD